MYLLLIISYSKHTYSLHLRALSLETVDDAMVDYKIPRKLTRHCGKCKLQVRANGLLSTRNGLSDEMVSARRSNCSISVGLSPCQGRTKRHHHQQNIQVVQGGIVKDKASSDLNKEALCVS